MTGNEDQVPEEESDSLVIVSEENSLKENFEPYFKEIKYYPLSDVRLNLLGDEEDVFVGETPVKEFDSLYMQVKPELSIFIRVMLENLEKDINTNLDSISSYILSKKQYLYKVLSEKNIPMPNTVIAGSERSASGVKELNFPIVARRFQGFKKREMSLLSDEEELEDFSRTTEYGKELLIFQEFVEGDVYKCLIIGDEVVSIKLENEGEWNLRTKNANEKYYNVSSEMKELAVEASNAIGAKVCRAKIVGDKIVDMRPNPDIKHFQDVSGKNTFEKIAKLLKRE